MYIHNVYIYIHIYVLSYINLLSNTWDKVSWGGPGTRLRSPEILKLTNTYKFPPVFMCCTNTFCKLFWAWAWVWMSQPKSMASVPRQPDVEHSRGAGQPASLRPWHATPALAREVPRHAGLDGLGEARPWDEWAFITGGAVGGGCSRRG